MASYNIEVNVREHKVDRSYPAILNGYYSESQFTIFCDKVDAIMQENVVPFRHKKTKWGIVSIAIPLVVGLVVWYLVEHRDLGDLSFQSIGLPLMFAVLFAGGCCYNCQVHQMSEVVKSKVKVVCEEA